VGGGLKKQWGVFRTLQGEEVPPPLSVSGGSTLDLNLGSQNQ
jgi:hypothetical protein